MNHERSDSEVLVDTVGHTMVITLNRPDARNAVNLSVADQVGKALERAENSAQVRAVILTGSGDRSFCAGADLKAIARGEVMLPPGREQWGFAGWTGHRISKPTICAVNGTALGGGTELVLASDLVIASDTASFGLPEVKRGLIAAAGGAFRLPKQIPHRVAMELLLTGRTISAERALELHLINAVVTPDRLMDEALAIAGEIAANAPLAVQATKRLALGRFDDEADSWRDTRTESTAIRATEDSREGPRAFAEKRAPVWRAR